MLSPRFAQSERTPKRDQFGSTLGQMLENEIVREHYEKACRLMETSNYSLPDQVVLFQWGFVNTKKPGNWIIFLNLLTSIPSSSYQRSIDFIYHELALRTLGNDLIEDKNKYGIIFSAALERISDSNRHFLLSLLVSSYATNKHGFISALMSLHIEQQRLIMNKVVSHAIKLYNVVLLNLCKDLNESHFTEITKALSVEEQEIVTILTSIKTREEQTKFIDVISDCTPYPGRITWEGGLLCCAQIRERKKLISFAPIVLKESDQFPEFVACLRQAQYPIRERFVITSAHWMSGEVFIDQYGVAHLLLIDTMGYSLSAIMTHIINSFVAAFPNNKIYIANEKRQSDGASCSTFSLDDVLHLYLVEDYLPAQYKSSGLFAYFADQVLPETKRKAGKTEVNLVKLPMVFMRTTQAHDLTTRRLPGRTPEEIKMSINRKGENLETYANRFFKPAPGISGKLHNVSIYKKWWRLVYENILFVRRTSYARIHALKQDFTLAAFKKRLEAQGVRFDRANETPRAKL